MKRICPDTNEVVVADEHALYSRTVICEDISFMSIPEMAEGERMECAVKVRYHHRPQTAVIEKTGDDRITVMFRDPVRAPAPGQSAVFYDEDGCVIGGGVIRESHS